MNQAIVTRHFLNTRGKGQKIRALSYSVEDILVDWDNESSVELNHAAACYALALKMGWMGEWRGGKLPTGGYCWVRGDLGTISV